MSARRENALKRGSFTGLEVLEPRLLLSSTPVVFLDSLFDAANWTVQEAAQGDGGTLRWTLHRSEVEGASRSITTTVFAPKSGSAGITGFFLRQGAVYDPAAMGAIGAIDYSERSFLFTGVDQGQASSLLILQNGRLYAMDPARVAPIRTTTTAWTRHSRTGLKAEDFIARSAGAAPLHPDFSATGAPLQFGFLRESSTVAPDPTGYAVEAYLDDWTVTVKPEGPRIIAVSPGPGAWIVDGQPISVTFDRDVRPETVTAESFRVYCLGPDRLYGTADDRQIPAASVVYNAATRTARFMPGAMLGNGRHAIVIGSVDGVPILENFDASTPAWTLGGSATLQGGALRLTDAQPYQAGSAFYSTRIPAQEFVADFDFSVGGGTGADGFAFVVHNNEVGPTGLEQFGGGMGYRGLTNSLAVEFDTFRNLENNDATRNHIGVNVNGSVESLVAVGPLPAFHNAGTFHATVMYSHGHIIVQVTGPGFTGAHTIIDTVVGGWNDSVGYFGFTAATGGEVNAHFIDNVRVQTNGGQAVRDPYGSPLDGESAVRDTVPSGNGTAGGDFVSVFDTNPLAPPNVADYFDEAYYLQINPDVAAAIAAGVFPSGLAHFVTSGMAEGRNPNLYFDTSYYLTQNPQVTASGMPAFEHFYLWGQSEGRSPSPVFESSYYMAMNPDVAAVTTDGYKHFLHFGRTEGRAASVLFDGEFYLLRNPDLLAAGVEPREHFLLFGRYENRSPSPVFDPTYYLQANPDLAAAGVNAFNHFVAYGRVENRIASPFFDPAFYRQDNPDTAAINSWYHFARWGQFEGRDPSPFFDASYYYQQNPDVAATGMPAFRHYVLWGIHENRLASPNFDSGYYLATNPDVAAVGMNAYDHFMRYGRYEQTRSPAPWFDSSFYYAEHPDVAATGESAANHFLRVGQFQGFAPNAYFDEAWYEAQHPSISGTVSSGSYRSAHEYYLLIGREASHSPGPFFDEPWYLADNPDVKGVVEAGGLSCGFEHFLLYGVHEGRLGKAA